MHKADYQSWLLKSHCNSMPASHANEPDESSNKAGESSNKADEGSNKAGGSSNKADGVADLWNKHKRHFLPDGPKSPIRSYCIQKMASPKVIDAMRFSLASSRNCALSNSGLSDALE